MLLFFINKTWVLHFNLINRHIKSISRHLVNNPVFITALPNIVEDRFLECSSLSGDVHLAGRTIRFIYWSFCKIRIKKEYLGFWFQAAKRKNYAVFIVVN